MQCTGHMRIVAGVTNSKSVSNHVVSVLCQPYILACDGYIESKNVDFWSRHDLDMKITQIDTRSRETTEFETEDMEGKSFYQLIHPEDISTMSTCHRILLHTEDIQTVHFRLITKKGTSVWLHSRGKVVSRHSRKKSIVFTHCPVREEDSTYIQQELVNRRHGIVQDKKQQHMTDQFSLGGGAKTSDIYISKINGCEAASYNQFCQDDQCPSSYHNNNERHSPVFPSAHHQTTKKYLYNNLNVPSFNHPYHCKEVQPCNSQKYCMYINGVRFTPTPCFYQQPTSTMYFHGQVTTYESNQTLNTDMAGCHMGCTASGTPTNFLPEFPAFSEVHQPNTAIKNEYRYEENGLDCMVDPTPFRIQDLTDCAGSHSLFRSQNHQGYKNTSTCCDSYQSNELPSMGSFLDYLHNL